MSSSTDACPACDGSAPRLLGTKDGHHVWRCAACDVVFSRVLPADVGREHLYDEYYRQSQFAVPATVQASLAQLVRSAARFRRTGRWLDMGYGEGALLKAAEQEGWQCYRTELSSPVLEYGRQRGWAVTADAAGDERFVKGAFDIVTMIEFLEHMPEPRRVLEDACRWLRPGGLLYLTTPNVRSLSGRLLGLDWVVVGPPDHVVLWTASALRRTVEATGFRVERLRAEGCHPHEIMAALRRRRDLATVNRVQAGIAVSAAMSRTWLRRSLKRAANAGLNVLGLGETLKLWAVRGN